MVWGFVTLGWRPGGGVQLSHQLLRLRVRRQDPDDREIYLRKAARGKGLWKTPVFPLAVPGVPTG